MKKILQCFFMMIFSVTGLRAQSYAEYLSQAKQYEGQKKWCYALGAYYDAMGTDESPENKKEAYEGYKTLKDAILSGNPGLGKYNQFSIHDEWKNLLIDAEKYGSNNNMYEITVEKLEQGDLDYSTKTATYNAAISYSHNSRYKNTITIIKRGYKVAYKEDWKDIPKDWPLYSASSKQNNVYNVDGALVYSWVVGHYDKEHTCYLNAFEMFNNDIWTHKTPGLYDYKFNIIDENGKEIVKGKRWLLAESKQISFSGVTPEVMDLIDNGKAYVNPIACYLEYGKYNSVDDNGGRTFIKNFPEVQLPLKKEEFICGKNLENFNAKNANLCIEHYKQLQRLNKLAEFNIEMARIDVLGIEMLKTEVTQELYELVIGTNPALMLTEHDVTWKGNEFPVVNVSWYDAIYFCNKLSELKGLEPVYTVDGITDTSKWNYKNHIIEGVINQNITANGFKLPTGEEWLYCAKGGVDYFHFAGSNNSEEVAWINKYAAYPVAQKKENGFGLYDMTGNVQEWCWDNYNIGKLIRGGFYYSNDYSCNLLEERDKNYYKPEDTSKITGFRIIRKISN